MRRDQLEIGLEREYALYARFGDTLAYVLANDRLLAALDDWQHMEGWRIAPEYSRCLVEITSPPHVREQWQELLDGFAYLEGLLARAAEKLGIECTAEYSVRTDRFATLDGTFVTTFSDLLLDPADKNWLLGSSEIPACLSKPELSYAGFTSTNLTIHPPMRELHAERLADYFWRLLSAARAIETASPQRHALLHDGRIPVPPDPELSIRDALIRWGDPATAALLDDVPTDQCLARFEALFGEPPSASFTTKSFHAYSCRPRLVENVMLFELRCFHSGMPLANLAPLMGVEF